MLKAQRDNIVNAQEWTIRFKIRGFAYFCSYTRTIIAAEALDALRLVLKVNLAIKHYQLYDKWY